MSPGRPRKWREGTRARMTTILPADLKQRLQRYSSDTGQDMSAIIAGLVRELLDAKGAK